MRIQIQTLAGTTRQMEFEPTDTIMFIKERLEELEGIPVRHQRISFKGKAQNNDASLNDCKVTAGCKLTMVLALRGG